MVQCFVLLSGNFVGFYCNNLKFVSRFRMFVFCAEFGRMTSLSLSLFLFLFLFLLPPIPHVRQARTHRIPITSIQSPCVSITLLYLRWRPFPLVFLASFFSSSSSSSLKALPTPVQVGAGDPVGHRGSSLSPAAVPFFGTADPTPRHSITRPVII